MKLSAREREANRAAFKAMGPAQKADYIFAYYKLPLVLILIVVVALGSAACNALTHKDALLYVAFVNVAPPEDVDAALTSEFVEASDADPLREEVLCYRELYVSGNATSANHQYAYASKLKLMAAVEGHQLDAVLMNKEAYDLLSASGYLLDLASGNAGHMFQNNPRLCSNTVVIESNQVEYELGEAQELETQTKEEVNALKVTDAPKLRGFSGSEDLYVGIIANTAKEDMALAYLEYVMA